MLKPIKHSLLLASAALLLSGCVHYAWVKPSGDPSTFGADNYACLQTANAQMPPVFQAFEATPQGRDSTEVDSVCTKHGPTTSCRTATVNRQNYYGQPVVADLNEQSRSRLFDACMGSKGWVYQLVEEPKS